VEAARLWDKGCVEEAWPQEKVGVGDMVAWEDVVETMVRRYALFVWGCNWEEWLVERRLCSVCTLLTVLRSLCNTIVGTE